MVVVVVVVVVIMSARIFQSQINPNLSKFCTETSLCSRGDAPG